MADETKQEEAKDSADVTEESLNKDMSLKDSVKAAMDAIAPKDKEDKEEKKGEKKEKSEAKAEGKAEEEEFDEDEVKKGVALLRDLSNPAKARGIIELLAREAGFLNAETKTEKQEAEKTLDELITEALGEDLGFASEKLTKAIRIAAEKVAEEKTKDIRETLQAERVERIQTHINESIDKIYGEYEIPAEVEKLASKLLDESRPAKGQTPYNYYKSLIFRAAAELDIPMKKAASAWINESKESKDTKSSNETQDARRERNRSDAKSRLASSKAEVKSEVDPKAKMSLRESVKAAVEAISQG